MKRRCIFWIIKNFQIRKLTDVHAGSDQCYTTMGTWFEIPQQVRLMF